MRDGLNQIVQSVIRHGLSLRDRLEAGEPLEPAVERATLMDMLAPLALEEVWDAQDEEPAELSMAASANEDERDRLSQSTIRYALICWLDSFLLRYSLWGSTWSKHSLEAALCGTNAHGKKFWDEARYAETRKDRDALEVLYWCAMLGFRGEGRGLSEPMGVWAARIRSLLDEPARQTKASVPPATPLAPALSSLSDLPYRRVLFAVLMTCSLSVPIVFWLARQLG